MMTIRYWARITICGASIQVSSMSIAVVTVKVGLAAKSSQLLGLQQTVGFFAGISSGNDCDMASGEFVNDPCVLAKCGGIFILE